MDIVRLGRLAFTLIFRNHFAFDVFEAAFTIRPIPESLASEKNNFVAYNENASPVTDEIHWPIDVYSMYTTATITRQSPANCLLPTADFPSPFGISVIGKLPPAKRQELRSRNLERLYSVESCAGRKRLLTVCIRFLLALRSRWEARAPALKQIRRIVSLN